MISHVPRAAAFILLASVPAHAIVITGGVTGGASLTQGGAFVELDALSGFSVGNNTFQDPNLYAFNEDQNITIPSTIDVDVGTSPVAGDVVASHYVFFDPLGVTRQQGFVDFDAEIYGAATSTRNLGETDFLVPSSVTYLNPGARGLESGDRVSIDAGNPMRLLVDWNASTPGDYVRIFTRESPGAGGGDGGDNGEGGGDGDNGAGGGDGGDGAAVIPLPAGLPLLVSALGLAGLVRRRRN